jgi:DNA processing protein
LGSPEAVFTASKKRLNDIPSIGKQRIESIFQSKENALKKAEAEIKYIEKNSITPLFFTDKNFPKRLLQQPDCPTLIYYKGNKNLNDEKFISIVGTRKITDYGKSQCEKIVEAFASYKATIVSGLAYGVDITAHKAAIKNNIATIAVVANGFDKMYPSDHIKYLKAIENNGGIITEYRSGQKADKQNFPQRNRIVAALCDALLVIETSNKGGAMITANIANDYNKDVFAFPGKVTDIKSEGCNKLIQLNKAHLITHANDLLEMMQWNEVKKASQKRSPQLFYDFNKEELEIMEFFRQKTDWQIDELCMQSKMNNSKIAAVLLFLEMNGIIISLPGKIYRCIL